MGATYVVAQFSTFAILVRGQANHARKLVRLAQDNGPGRLHHDHLLQKETKV